MAECNITTLQQEACDSGFACLNEQWFQAVLLQLLCDINAGSSAAASAVVTGAFANPNGNVTPTSLTSAALYYEDSPTPNQWYWSVDDQVWYQNFGP